MTILRALPLAVLVWAALEVVWPSAGDAQAPARHADAAGGNDGVKNGRWGFHTSRDVEPWWQVDLGRSFALGRVLVYNRCDDIWVRAAHLMLQVSEDGEAWRTVYRHDGSRFYGATDGKPLAIELRGARARFVRVQLPESGYLHLDEIEVYGADGPDKNLALGRPADQSSSSQWSSPRGVEVEPPPLKATIESGLELAADLSRAGVDVESCERALRDLLLAAESAPGAEHAELRLHARRTIRELALLNPLLDFDRLLLVKRRAGAPALGLPANWQSNCALPRAGFDDEIAVLSPNSSGTAPASTRIFKSDPGRRLVDRRRSPLRRGPDALLDALGRATASLADPRGPARRRDRPASGDARTTNRTFDSYDSCYLPNDGHHRVLSATAALTGRSLCQSAASHRRRMMYRMDRGRHRPFSQVCFEQDHDYCPSVLNDGRVLYSAVGLHGHPSRVELADPHSA